MGVLHIEGRASDDQVMREAGIERARAVIACIDSDAENIFATLTARELRPDIQIVARAAEESSERKLIRAGANDVVSPYKTSGRAMAQLALDRARGAPTASRHLAGPAGRRPRRDVGLRRIVTAPPGRSSSCGARVEAAAALRGGGGESADPTLERPPRAEFGDYSSNVAMLLAPALGGAAARDRRARRRGADAGARGTRSSASRWPAPGSSTCSCPTPGSARALAAVRDEGERFGAGVVAGRAARAHPGRVRERQSDRSADRRGRPARRLGDSLARVLEFAGHEVEREYYVNDYGTQVELFGRSIAARDDGRASCPRTAIRATTSASSPSGCGTRGSIPPTSPRSRAAASS